jgi:branched-chain amino acid transport system substrate-binding protein
LQPQIHPRCEKTFPQDLFTDPAKHRDTIVYGSLFNRDNETQAARENSIELAIRQINEESGLESRMFGVVFCDIAPKASDNTKTTADAALIEAGYLTKILQVPVILGPAGSNDVSAVFEAIRGSGTLLISPSATSPALTTIDVTAPNDQNPGLLWRTAPPDSLQGEAIASDMGRRGVAKVAVIAQSGSYGEGLSEIFNAHFGGEIDLRVFSNPNQLTEAIIAAGNSNATEVLFIASAQEDVITFMSAAGTIAGYGDKRIFLTDSAATNDTLANTPPSLFPKVRGTRPSQLSTRDTVYGTFVASYSAEFQQDVQRISFTAQAYDMTWVAMLGTAWALLREDGISGRNIARGARRLSGGEEFALTPSKWGGMLQRMRSGSGFDIRGASGALDYDPNTEETRAPIDVWTIDTTGAEPSIIVDYVSGDDTQGKAGAEQ